MDQEQECPKCGLVNPPSTRWCDCGYDFIARQVDRHHAPKHESSASGLVAVYRAYWVLLGGGATLAGIGFLSWELSKPSPSLPLVACFALISLFGIALAGAVIWFGKRS